MRHMGGVGSVLAVFLVVGCASEPTGTQQESSMGFAGTGAIAGFSGGIAGSFGAAGTGDPAAGTGGFLPTAGTGGAAGAGGVAGFGGIAGTDGAAGTDGMAGIGGTAGVDGMAGTGGMAGFGGMAGTDGAAGTGAPTGGLGERGADPTVQSATAEGPYDVKTYTSGFRDGPLFGSATIHYPSDAEPPFASMAVVPGYLSAESSIRAWGPFLASHGIVTMTIGTNALGDYPAARAKALMDAIETLKAEHTRSGGPLEGKLSLSHFGVMGWSMGGGGTLIAARDNPTKLKAAIALCGWETNKNFGTNTVPHLLFGGQNDTTANPDLHAIPHYQSIPQTTPKMYFEVTSGSHSVANNPTGGMGEVGRYGLSWLKVFLEGDSRYMEFLDQKPTRSVDFRPLM